VLRNRRCLRHLRSAGNEVRPRLTKAERLAEIRRRHELMRREIQKIKESLEEDQEDED
jgi:phosphomevalonate kinase